MSDDKVIDFGVNKNLEDALREQNGSWNEASPGFDLLRLEALQMAMHVDGQSPEQTVKRAQAFYDFLVGK